MKFLVLFTLIVSCFAFPFPTGKKFRQTQSSPLENFKSWNPTKTVAYLQRFGYISKNRMRKVGSLIDINSFSKSIKEFQRMAGIKVTGKMNSDTINKMSLPRCGVEDTFGAFMMGSDGNIADSKFRNKNQRRQTNQMKRRRAKKKGVKSRTKRYNLEGGEWTKTNLKYHILNYTRDMERGEVKQAIRKALNLWAKHSNLKFTFTSNKKKADLKISFGTRNHGDYYPFDGQGGTLAHAFFPSNGQVHFDDDEDFTEGKPEGINLFIVAAHEFGHSLGLAHSNVPDSLMAPFYQGYVPNYKLHSDDIAAIQHLYGKNKRFKANKPPPSPPPPTATTLVPPRPGKKPKGNPMLICGNKISFDSMHYNRKDEALYAFKGHFFWNISDQNGAMPEFPQEIHDYWRHLPANINASVYSEQTGNTYFFKGQKVWKYSKSKKLFPGYPQKSSSLGLPPNPQAAMQWGRDGFIYVFKNARFYKFSEFQKKKYPSMKTSKYWEGIPNRLDAAIQWKNGKTYFFKGNKFWRFSGMEKKMDVNHARSFKKYWVGCQYKNNPFAIEAKKAKEAEKKARRERKRSKGQKKKNRPN